jgi:co-chaperonin GroES (HSP10)
MNYDPIEVSALRALHDHVLVSDMSFDQRITTGGIVLLNDDGRSAGIRPRWGRVYAVGPEQHDVQVGDWVLVAHGRWTRGFRIRDAQGVHVVRRVDADDMMMVSDHCPSDDTISDAI